MAPPFWAQKRRTLCPTCPGLPRDPAGSLSLSPEDPGVGATDGPQLATGRWPNDRRPRSSLLQSQEQEQTWGPPRSWKNVFFFQNVTLDSCVQGQWSNKVSITFSFLVLTYWTYNFYQIYSFPRQKLNENWRGKFCVGLMMMAKYIDAFVR